MPRAARTGLDRATILLLRAALPLALLHHADHILRVDHSGWPFRAEVSPFTYSLLAYPVILFALHGPRQLFGWRLALLTTATLFTIVAHTLVESPAAQFAMWAHGHSLDRDAAGLTNLPGIRSAAAGWLSMAIGMALNVTAVAATIAMLARGLRLRRAA